MIFSKIERKRANHLRTFFLSLSTLCFQTFEIQTRDTLYKRMNITYYLHDGERLRVILILRYLVIRYFSFRYFIIQYLVHYFYSLRKNVQSLSNLAF